VVRCDVVGYCVIHGIRRFMDVLRPNPGCSAWADEKPRGAGAYRPISKVTRRPRVESRMWLVFDPPRTAQLSEK